MGFSSHVILFSLPVPNWLIIFSFSYSNSGAQPPVLLDRILHTSLVTGQPVESCSWPRHEVICLSWFKASTEPLLSAGTRGWGSFPSNGRTGVAVTMIVTWFAVSGAFCFLNLFPFHSVSWFHLCFTFIWTGLSGMSSSLHLVLFLTLPSRWSF